MPNNQSIHCLQSSLRRGSRFHPDDLLRLLLDPSIICTLRQFNLLFPNLSAHLSPSVRPHPTHKLINVVIHSHHHQHLLLLCLCSAFGPIAIIGHPEYKDVTCGVDCYRFYIVYRMALGTFIYHAIQAVALIGIQNPSQPRVVLQEGYRMIYQNPSL